VLTNVPEEVGDFEKRGWSKNASRSRARRELALASSSAFCMKRGPEPTQLHFIISHNI
jgi:hypothetical protein